MNTPTTDTVYRRLFTPMFSALTRAKHRRQCPEYTDAEFLVCGVRRVIAQVQSGRDWVQRIRTELITGVTVATFFQSLRSKRRLALSEEVASDIVSQVDQECGAEHDPLVEHEELRGYHVYASDGHYEAAASHTPHIQGKIYAPGCLYSLNLRSHSLSFLDVTRPRFKKESEITALKRLSTTQLRMNAPMGTKVVHVYDPAVVDYRQWQRWKAKGIYIITREKENSAALTVGAVPVDKTDPRNIGVVADEFIGVSSGLMIRRVVYQDPATGKVFNFITNEMKLPPGLIAFLYKLRWDVEKVFDEKKNKLLENKAWGITPTARCLQALFVCMAHNLMVLLERQLERDEGIRDTKAEAKRQRRVERLKEQIRESGHTANPMVIKCTRITQRSLQFIRWLRCSISRATPWPAAVEALRPLMANYLT